MKVFKAHDSTDVLERLYKRGTFTPGDVAFDFAGIVEATGMTEPETIMIMWNGVHYLVDYPIVRNAWLRERTLAKHSEYFTKGDKFKPTVITLSQCSALADEAVQIMERVRMRGDDPLVDNEVLDDH
jgi:hypothetical protein